MMREIQLQLNWVSFVLDFIFLFLVLDLFAVANERVLDFTQFLKNLQLKADSFIQKPDSFDVLRYSIDILMREANETNKRLAIANVRSHLDPSKVSL